jgi:phage tail tape-measure protein
MNPNLTRKEFLLPGAISATGLLFAGSALAGGPEARKIRAAEQSAGEPGADERLVYNNPFHQRVKIAWCNGKQVRHLSGLGAITVQPSFSVAQQYNMVYEDRYHGSTDTVAKFEAQKEKYRLRGL